MPNWTRTWKLNDGPENVFAPNCELEIKAKETSPVANSTSPVSFFVTARSDNASSWRDTWLVQRGSTELSWPNPGKPLKAWTPEQEFAYDKRISHALSKADANTLRLEGEIEVNGKKELVMFFVGKKAVERPGKEPADILIIRSRMSSLFELVPNQDGTAHGNPR